MLRWLQVFALVSLLSLAATSRASVKISPLLRAAPSPVVSTARSQDETWTVIEYPEGREVVVELKPAASTPSAKGTARVTRSSNETAVSLEVTGLTDEPSVYQVYAVDFMGNSTLLGTLTLTDGAGNLNAKSALSKFMLIVSPDTDLTTVGPETNVVLRSAVPEGFSVIQRESAGVTDDGTINVTLRKDTETVEPREYDVPLLSLSSLKVGTESQMRARLGGGYEGARVNVTVRPRRNGTTEIKVRFQDLKKAENGARYILWALGPDNSYTLLGPITPTRKTGESAASAETTLKDFGLLVTTESTDAVPSSPTGSVVVTMVR